MTLHLAEILKQVITRPLASIYCSELDRAIRLLHVLAITICAIFSLTWAGGSLAQTDQAPDRNLKILQDTFGPTRSDPQWRKLAEGGDLQAQSEQCSVHGIKNDVDSDYYSKVVSWCQKDANEGSIQAEYALANCYASGLGGLPQDWTQAYFWYRTRITKHNLSSKEADAAAAHLTADQISDANGRVDEWTKKLCATNPTNRNLIVERGWHCESD